jgi:hypothetical protein
VCSGDLMVFEEKGNPLKYIELTPFHIHVPIVRQTPCRCPQL